MTVRTFAPAKLNLALHVTGRRDDGYHLLDSFVVFADIGDRVEVSPSAVSALGIGGPEAGSVPQGTGNSALRAAELVGLPARIGLWKELPVAAGLGGGSADAAATLRALAAIGGRELPADEALALGADVPVCLRGTPARMSGIGETLAAVPPLPPAWLVLVNPRTGVSTAEVFRRLDGASGSGMPENWPSWRDAPALARWLAGSRNDLEAPALGVAPVIGNVLEALRSTEGCLLARMSGSGATCFGLYGDAAGANAAAARLAEAHPEWWIRPAGLLSKAPPVEAQVTRATT